MFKRFKRQLQTKVYRSTINREERPWLEIDESEFWLLARQDLIAQKLYLKRCANPRDLFSEEERRQKRNRNAKQVQTVPESSDTPWYRKIFGTEPIETNLNATLRTAISDFFTPNEVDKKLRPYMLRLERRFRGNLQSALRSFKQYLDIVKHLPEDDVERQIQNLRLSYLTIGLRREWYHGYKAMVEAVVRESTHSSLVDGQNEPAVRVLQLDFLQTMASRIDTYRKFQHLRTYCFENGLTDEVDLIERKRSQIGTTERLIREPVAFEEIQSLVTHLEQRQQEHLLNQQQTSAKSNRKRTVSERQVDWARLKETLRQRKVGSKAVVEDLKLIVDQNHGWRLGYQALKIANAEHNANKTRELLEQIVRRIEREFATDIEFQHYRDNVKQSQTEDPDLNETLAEIRLQYALHGADALDTVHDLKTAFLRSQQSDQGHNVTPLFSR